MDENTLRQLCEELEALKRSANRPSILAKFDQRFDRIIMEVLPQCLRRTLTRMEKAAIDLVSSLELIIIQHLMELQNEEKPLPTNQFNVGQRFFLQMKIGVLAVLVEVAQEENLDDDILLYLSRMIDARALSYQWFWNELPPQMYLNKGLGGCVKHQKTKDALDQTNFPGETRHRISVNTQRFFLGSSTFAVASFSKDEFQLNADDTKLVCRFAKFVRTILSEENFVENEANVYCLRGIFALLTHNISREYWLPIINEALASESGSPARQRNPFNAHFFSSIFSKLLGSPKLQKDARESTSNDGALLVDIALVFLERWCYTALNDENDETPRVQHEQHAE